MPQDNLTPLLTFSFEVPVHQELFAATPMRIVEVYLQCFDEAGVQRFGVPKHVLEALAIRFRALMDKEHNSLDEAFGGRIARQRNKLLHERTDYGIVFDHMGARERAARLPAKERGKGTPFEIADEAVAEKHGTSPENVRRIYRKSRKRT